jgi:hypothetical protein
MLRYSLVCVVGLCLAVPAWAGSWADVLFEEASKDFGTVPHGPSLTHLFRLTNNLDRPLHISGVRVSCGCTSARARKSTVQPGKSTVIEARMDTQRFFGSKTVTIFVTFDQPQWAEARLWVQANSRDDLSVTPETLTIGRAKRGSAASATVNVTFQGDGHWQIVGVERESNYVQTSVKEIRRAGTDIRYRLTATMRPDTPVGKWYSDVWLKTSNPSMPRIRVPLNVEIEAPLSLSSAMVTLGDVKAGDQAERKIIVRGAQPFRITKIEGADEQLTVQDSTTESQPAHVLTITLKSDKVGEVNRRLKVVTDLKEDGEIEFQAKGQVTNSDSPE